MMKCEIQIGNGQCKDCRDGYGLIYMSSDNHFGAPTRDYETTSYAEEAGEHIDNRTTETAFDLKFTFVAEVSGKELSNGLHLCDRITQLNNLLFEKVTGTDILQANRVTIYDHYKHRKIVGYPKQKISEPREDDVFYVREQECAVIELTLRIDNPKLCNFTSDYAKDKPAN